MFKTASLAIISILIFTYAANSQDIQVNTYTGGDQISPAIASNSEGRFIIVWSSTSHPGSIHGQLFLPGELPFNNQFEIAEGARYYPSVDIDSSGNFVVVWNGEDGHRSGIRGQRFSSEGQRIGGTFQVNQSTYSYQDFPKVAMTDDGRFTVAWDDYTDYASARRRITARQFNSDGSPSSQEFRVSNSTYSEVHPSISSNEDGDFVITWHTLPQSYQSISQSDVFARTYYSDGSPKSGRIAVNTYTTGTQLFPEVSIAANGDFVIVWESTDSPGGTRGTSVYGQRYTSNGSPVSYNFQINDYPLGSQLDPAVAMSADGAFTVFWTSDGSHGDDTHFHSIQGQIYNSFGARVGNNFQVNSYTTGSQISPAIAIADDRSTFVTWQSNGSHSTDTSGKSIQFKARPGITSVYRTAAPIGRPGIITAPIYATSSFDYSGVTHPQGDLFRTESVAIYRSDGTLVADQVAFPVNLSVDEYIEFRFSFIPNTVGLSADTFALQHAYGEDRFQLIGASSDGICIYVDDSTLSGHAFVEFLPEDPNLINMATPILGKYPQGNYFYSTAAIKDDSHRQWVARICYPVQPWQYRASETRAMQLLDDAGNFTVLSKNCVDLTAELALLSGVGLPRYSWPLLGIPDPRSLRNSLLQAGHLSQVEGGVIEISGAEDRTIHTSTARGPCANNPSTVRKGNLITCQITDEELTRRARERIKNSPLPAYKKPPRPLKSSTPYSYSISGIIESLYFYPEETAQVMQMPLTEHDLGEIDADDGGNILLHFNDVIDEEKRFTVTHWGDQEFRFENLSAPGQVLDQYDHHSYKDTGSYDAKVFALTPGGLYTYSFKVNVASVTGQAKSAKELVAEKGSGLLSIEIPDEPPVITPNGGIPPENFPLPTPNLHKDGFESGDTSAWSGSSGT